MSVRSSAQVLWPELFNLDAPAPSRGHAVERCSGPDCGGSTFERKVQGPLATPETTPAHFCAALPPPAPPAASDEYTNSFDLDEFLQLDASSSDSRAIVEELCSYADSLYLQPSLHDISSVLEESSPIDDDWILADQMPSSSSGALFSVLDDAVFAQPPETMIPAVHHSPPLARPDVRTEGSHSFGATPPVTPAVDFETLLTQALVVHATSPNPNPNPAMFAPLLDLDQSLPAALATLAAIAAPESPLLFAPTFADAGAKVSSFPSPSQSSTCSKRPRCSAAERSDSSAPAKRRKTRATPIVVVDGSPAATTLSPDDIHCVVEPTGQRVFLCPHPGCSLKAKRRFNVETHLKTHDANRTKNFQCRTCGCLFFRPYELVRHVERKGH